MTKKNFRIFNFVIYPLAQICAQNTGHKAINGYLNFPEKAGLLKIKRAVSKTSQPLDF